MTDKTVSVPQSFSEEYVKGWNDSREDLVREGLWDGKGPTVSVPTESRCSTSAISIEQRLEDIEELLWSHEAHCLICNEPINCDCRRSAACGIHKVDCPIPKVLDKIKQLAEAASSSLLPVPRQIQVQCEMCDGTGQMHVTHDMAIDAGNLNLSGQLISCGTCGGDGFEVEQAEPNGE